MDNKSFFEMDIFGTKRWKDKNGQPHRLDGPATERADGDKYWFQCGKLHRLDGPAIEGADGRKLWYQNGKLHRLGGPAVIYDSGCHKEWYKNGKLFENKDDFFESLTDEEKSIALFSEDFLNG